MNLLHVDSSIQRDASVSRALSAAIVTEWRRTTPDLNVTYRDLDAEPVLHLDSPLLAAAYGAEANETTQANAAMGTQALEEFLAADIVVVGAPMYNFTVSSQLKTWLDRLAVAGKTFAYTENGAQGLAGGKKVIVASSRGGIYSAGPMTAMDFQETYLRAMFGFFGIGDVSFVRAEGTMLGAEHKQRSIEAALNAIPAVVLEAGTALRAA